MSKQKRPPLDINRLPANTKREGMISPDSYQSKPRSSGVATGMRDVGNNLFATIVAPTVKRLIMDFITNALSMVFFQQGAPGPQGGSPNHSPLYRPYHTQYGRQSPVHTQQSPQYAEVRGSMLEDMFFFEYGDAAKALGYLKECLHTYGRATIADYYHILGRQTTFPHQTYGWTNLSQVPIYSTPDGYVIGLPEPKVV